MSRARIVASALGAAVSQAIERVLAVKVHRFLMMRMERRCEWQLKLNFARTYLTLLAS